MYQDIPFLSNTERSISRLVFDRGVPPAVEVDHVTGGREVQSGTAGLEREDEERRPILALKALDKPLPLGDRGAAVKHEPGPPEHALEKLGEGAGDLAELGENKRLLLAFAKLFAERGQALKLAALLGRVVAGADQLGRMVADLLELHELGEDEPAPLDAVGFLELLGQIAYGLLIEGGLLPAQSAEGRHLDLFGQVGDHSLVGLEPAQDVRPDERAERLVGRTGLHLLDKDRANVLAPPSRPGFRKSNSDQRSDRRFSTGVPVMATRAAAFSSLTVRDCRVPEFLIAWASSRMTRSQSCCRSHSVRDNMP